MPAVAVRAIISAGIAATGSLVLPWAASTIFIKTFALNMVLGGLSRALAPKAKKPNLGIAPVAANTFSIRQPNEEHKHVYGHTRISDIYAHIMGGNSSGKMHLILCLCASEITAIDEIWVNDYAVPADWIDANGDVTAGRYAGKLRMRKHLGAPDQPADSVAVAEIEEWTESCTLSGIAYIYITLEKDTDVFPNGIPNFSAIVRGRKVYDPRSFATGFTSNICLFAHDFLSNDAFGFGSNELDDTNIASQANICDEIVSSAVIAINTTAIDTASDIITLEGTINPLQWGDRVEVSGSSIPGGLAALTAYYVIITQVKDTPRIMLASSLTNAFASSAINITTAGADVVITKTGEPRYHGAGIIDTDNTLEESLSAILSGMAGRPVYAGGALKLLAGAYRSPDVELTISDFTGGINTAPKIKMSERFNTISGTYISSINNYQPSDYPVYRVQSFIDADNGVEYPRSMELPFTNRHTTAQRITKIEALKSRQEIGFTTQCNMKGAIAECGDTVEITIDRYGWAQKEFEVTSFSFSVVQNGNLSTNLTLRETDASVYDWSSVEDASVDPAPNTNLPNAYTVTAPGSVAYNSRGVTTVGGDTVYNLVLEWAAPSDVFVTNGGRFEVQYKESAEAAWRPSFFVAGDTTFTDVPNTSPNTEYDLRIRSVNLLGVHSGWQTILGALIGTSGGVLFTNDWGSAADAPASFNDWGSAADAPTSFNDWGTVV